MKKKYIILSALLALFTSFALLGCSEGGNGTNTNTIPTFNEGNIQIEGVKPNISDGVISFTVEHDTNVFNLDTIRVEGFSLRFFKDKKEVKGEAQIEYGRNEFTFTVDGLDNISYSLVITRKEKPVILDSIEITSLKDSYFVGEEFVNGYLLSKYSNGKEEKVEITLDMVDGFDTTTPGEKKLTISYNGKSIEVVINVEVQADSYVDMAKYLYTYVNALQSPSLNRDDFDNAFKNAQDELMKSVTEDDLANILDYINKLEPTIPQLNEIERLMKGDIFLFIKDLYMKGLPLHKYIMTLEDKNIIKGQEIAYKLINLFTDEQLSNIVPTNVAKLTTSVQEVIQVFNPVKEAVESLDLEGFLNNFTNEVKDQFRVLENINGILTDKAKLLFVKAMKNSLKAIVSVDVLDIKFFIQAFDSYTGGATDPDMEDLIIKNTYIASYNLMKLIYDNTNKLEDFYSLFEEILNNSMVFSNFSDLSTYLEYISLAREFTPYMDKFILASAETKTEFYTIYSFVKTFIDINNGVIEPTEEIISKLYVDGINIVKIYEGLITELKDDKEFASLMNKLMYNNGTGQLDVAKNCSLLLEICKIDTSLPLTNEDLELISTTMATLTLNTKKVAISGHNTVVLEKGSSFTSFVEMVNAKMTFASFDSNEGKYVAMPITEASFTNKDEILEVLKNGGRGVMKVLVDGNLVTSSFYAYTLSKGAVSTDELVYSFAHYIAYVDSEGNVLKIKNERGELSNDAFLSYGYKLYFSDVKATVGFRNTGGSYKLILNESPTDEIIQNGVYEMTTDNGLKIYLPARYIVVDLANPHIDYLRFSKSGTNEIAIGTEDTLFIASTNYGYDIFGGYVPAEDITEVANKTYIMDRNGVSLSLGYTVITKEQGMEILNINGVSDEIYPEDIESYLDFKNHYLLVEARGDTDASYTKDMALEVIRRKYNNPDIQLRLVVVEISNQYEGSFRAEFYSLDKIYEQYEFSENIIAKEEYYRFNIASVYDDFGICINDQDLYDRFVENKMDLTPVHDELRGFLKGIKFRINGNLLNEFIYTEDLIGFLDSCGLNVSYKLELAGDIYTLNILFEDIKSEFSFQILNEAQNFSNAKLINTNILDQEKLMYFDSNSLTPINQDVLLKYIGMHLELKLGLKLGEEKLYGNRLVRAIKNNLIKVRVANVIENGMVKVTVDTNTFESNLLIKVVKSDAKIVNTSELYCIKEYNPDKDTLYRNLRLTDVNTFDLIANGTNTPINIHELYGFKSIERVENTDGSGCVYNAVCLIEGGEINASFTFKYNAGAKGCQYHKDIDYLIVADKNNITREEFARTLAPVLDDSNGKPVYGLMDYGLKDYDFFFEKASDSEVGCGFKKFNSITGQYDVASFIILPVYTLDEYTRTSIKADFKNEVVKLSNGDFVAYNYKLNGLTPEEYIIENLVRFEFINLYQNLVYEEGDVAYVLNTYSYLIDKVNETDYILTINGTETKISFVDDTNGLKTSMRIGIKYFSLKECTIDALASCLEYIEIIELQNELYNNYRYLEEADIKAFLNDPSVKVTFNEGYNSIYVTIATGSLKEDFVFHKQ